MDKLMFKIKQPPKEPTKRQKTDIRIDEYLFDDKPVSQWEAIIRHHLDNILLAPTWDRDSFSMDEVFLETEWEYYDSQEVKLVVWVYETEESYLARLMQWEKSFREWEEWTYHHQEEIDAEMERREIEKIKKLELIMNHKKQLALKAEREFRKFANTGDV